MIDKEKECLKTPITDYQDAQNRLNFLSLLSNQYPADYHIKWLRLFAVFLINRVQALETEVSDLKRQTKGV